MRWVRLIVGLSLAATMFTLVAPSARADDPGDGGGASPVATSDDGYTDETRPVAIVVEESEVETPAPSSKVGRTVLAASAAASSCSDRTVTRKSTNIFGGTLFELSLTLHWCHNGRSVSGIGYSWSRYTNFGWRFADWSDPPDAYDNPSHTQANAVAQAQFCLTVCAGTSHYLGQHIWGDTVGRSDWAPL